MDFLQQMFGTNIVELVASVAGFLCVYLIIKRNSWCWPVGLVQVVLYIYVFYQAKLYSDVMLHGVYVLMQFYGWWYWAKSTRNSTKIEIIGVELSLFFVWLSVAALGTVGLGWAMKTYTNADFAYTDAFTTVTSLVAQWLLARRHLLTWFFWIAVDFIAIGIYWQKALYPTAVLYLLFLVMASTGLVVWWREYQQRLALRAVAGEV